MRSEPVRERSHERVGRRVHSVRAAAQERGAGASRGGRWAAIKVFFRDAWLELQKVNWPAQEDVAKMTGLVVAVVVVVGLFVFVWDSILSRLIFKFFLR